MIYSLTVTNSIGESLTFELSNPWASGYAIKEIDGLGTPDMNVNTTPYGIGDGSVLGSIKAEYRLITIILWPLTFPTVETARQHLYRYFQIKKNIVLTFNTENRLVTIDGYVQKIEPNIFDNPETISIELKCIDPYFHKMKNDLTKFYGIEPTFEFPFSVEFEFDDNVIWDQRESYRDVIINDIVFGNGRFIGVGRGDKYPLTWSIDGINWADCALPMSKEAEWTGITYGNGLFVAIFTKSNIAAYSSDGEDWRLTNLPFETDWKTIAYGDGKFVAIPKNGSYGAYSTDGIEWERVNLSINTPEEWTKIIFGNGRFLAIKRGTDIAAYSADGINWTRVKFPSEAPWNDVACGNGVFVFSRSIAGNWLYTKDLVSWSYVDQPYPDFPFILHYGNNAFYAVKEGSNTALTSSDGAIWLSSTLPVVTNWKHIISGNGRLIVLSDGIFSAIATPGFHYIEPIEFSRFTVDNRMTIDYDGEIDTGIMITIECQTPPGDIIIYNVDTLEYIQIFAERIEAVSGYPLGPKDIIEINTESGNKYVRLLRNGIYYNILGAMNRGMTWFTLQQGPNTFTYTTTDEHAAISMTFSYRDSYAAI